MKYFATILLALLTACESITDRKGDCGVWLEFRFDHNMEFADAFNPMINRVDVCVFDNDGKFLFSRSAERSQLVNGNRMHLGDDMAQGTYKILAVGNLCDDFDFTADGAPFVNGVSTIDQASLRLRNDGTSSVSHRFEHLYFAPELDVQNGAKASVWRVPFMRLTNRFHVTLETTHTGSQPVGDYAPQHTVCITAPEQGRYDHKAQPTHLSQMLYHPHELRSSVVQTSTGSMVRRHDAALNTMRLVDGQGSHGGYRIAVRDIASGSEVWGGDLLHLLQTTNRTPRPDGSAMPLSEYLDRQSEWNVVIVHGGSQPDGSGFAALQIIINGWIVWNTEMEVRS